MRCCSSRASSLSLVCSAGRRFWGLRSWSRPAALGDASLLDLRSLTGAALALGRILLRALLVALRVAPLGVLAVFVFPDQGSRLSRAGLVALPALVVATPLAWLALAARAGSAPGPFEVLLPGLGILIGVWAARLAARLARAPVLPRAPARAVAA
jgi:hypothetical protein